MTGSRAHFDQAIIQSAEELIRRIMAWLQDRHGKPVIPESVIAQIRDVDRICQKPMSHACWPVRTAIGRLRVEYEGYVHREHGKIRLENGAPGPSFWAAVKQFATARQSAEQPVYQRLEPVAVLLKQGVTHSQIGLQMYGRRGVGPFVQANGDVDMALIEREAKVPGSVIAADWVPPWQQAGVARRRRQLDERLALFTRMETARHYDDPCTVEEMLKQGAYVQQIERAKGVSRRVVLAAAKQLGVPAIDGPAYRPVSHELNGPSESLGPADKSSAISLTGRDALKRVVIDLFQISNGRKGAAEIAYELRLQGYDIKTNVVAAIVGHWKKRQDGRDVVESA